jgi:hypothetical protein
MIQQALGQGKMEPVRASTVKEWGAYVDTDVENLHRSMRMK